MLVRNDSKFYYLKPVYFASQAGFQHNVAPENIRHTFRRDERLFKNTLNPALLENPA